MFIISRVFLNVMFSVQIKGEYSGGNGGFLLYYLGKFKQGRAYMDRIAKMFSLGKMVARGLHTHA